MVIDSTRAYRPLWICFRVLVPTFFGARSRTVFVLMVIVHFLITVMFPLHLLLGLMLQGTPAERLKNLTLSILSTACSLKHIMHVWHLPQMMEIEKLLHELDKSVQSDEEHHYCQETLQCHVNRITRCIYTSFAVVYIAYIPTILLAILAEPRELLYVAWLPFDWRQSGLHYSLAFSYQILSIMIECMQALANDIYSPLTLCYVSGHIHLLGIRVSRLGVYQKSERQTRQQLRACFEDYSLLMRLYQLTRETISSVQFIQVVFCGTNLCIVVSYVLLFVRDTLSLMYNAVLFIVICLQLFPSCYFASDVAEEACQLPYAIFSSNWYEQSAHIRRNILVFTQLTLRVANQRMMAGFLELNLNTFFTTLKMAYSLFAVVSQVKN
ncbi:odorant receptor 33c [Drosophila grimshawi]|uniref:Odorant receptor n=1 Tax=Drosophila grimshawi TaxID=7222 RepID=B4JR42_DROGR|nr:odorant receptor 33c [Drosophila grimshawi]EDV99372.1 GH13813 [Drosophila grimshawi]